MKILLSLLLCCLTYGLYGQTIRQFGTDTINFNSSGVSLQGTIFKPVHPNAAVVLVHGSGQDKKEGAQIFFVHPLCIRCREILIVICLIIYRLLLLIYLVC
jgi:hypothetical protein